MITRIILSNFKSFRDLKFDAGRLNVLTGLNGSGKSSLIQAMLFLRGVLAKGERSPWHVALHNGDHIFGTYSDLHYAYSQSGDDLVRVQLSTDWTDKTFRFAVQDCESQSDEVAVLNESPEVEDSEWKRASDELSAIQYVSAYRLPPQSEHIYSVTKARKRIWGGMGELAVAYLAENGLSTIVDDTLCRSGSPDHYLSTQVDAWMDVVSPGACITAEMVGRLNKAMLSISFARGVNNHPFMPQNVGFGISYVLPLVVMLLSSRPGDCLIVENPEAHLHPQGQAELGRLMALVAARGVQVFVESHSDHVLNGIRVSVKNHEILPGHVNVAFFTRKVVQTGDEIYEQESDVDPIRIVDGGEFDHFPSGFLDEWNKQLLALLRP